MGRTSKHLCLIGLAAGLLLPSVALADGPTEVAKGAQGEAPKASPPTASRGRSPWPAAIKHRNARYAVLGRSVDEAGDDHEAFVLQYELKRRADGLGDLEETRIHAAFLKGRRGTLHVHVLRDMDRFGDTHQSDLAKLHLSRRFADFRRLRDFSGDKVELAAWQRDRLRWGDLGPKRIGTQAERLYHADQTGDDSKRRHSENKLDQRETGQQEDEAKRDEKREERQFERSLQDSRAERQTERDEERDEEQLDDEAEEALEDGEERDEERELEREEEAATEKAITSSENGETLP